METRSNQFVTVFYGILDASVGRLDYSSAGHCPPYLVRAQEEIVQELAGQGAPLGMFGDRAWPAQSARLNPGDVLVLYTDGITEARNAQKEFYGEERLVETLCAHRQACARDIQAAIMEGIDTFTGDSAHSDDITLVLLVRDR